MRFSAFARVGILIGTVVVMGCEPAAERVLRPRPVEPYLRDVVVVGDSWMAGVQAGALTKRLQLDSVPAILAEAFGTSIDPNEALTQPLIANPGYPVYTPFRPAGVWMLVGVSPPQRARFVWSDTTLVENVPSMRSVFELERDLPRSFRNFAHPGCFAYDVIHARQTSETWTAVFEGNGNLFLETVLRPGLEGQLFQDSLTVLRQLKSRSPRLAVVGLGFDELFHAAVYGDGVVPYAANEFEEYVGEIVDSLRVETDGRVVILNRPRFDRLYEFGALDLGEDDRTLLLAADDAYAAAITNVADSRDVVLVDVRRWYEDVATRGLTLGGVALDLSIFGGVTSLDGLSPTSLANALIANLVIERLNDVYGTAITPVDTRPFLDQSVITDVDVLFFREEAGD